MIHYFKMAMTEKYAEFNGRSTRSEFWYFTLALILILLAVSAITGMLVFSAIASDSDIGIGLMVLFGVFAILYLGILVPSIAISIRRLHDTGKSGWWYMINFVPYLGFVVYIVFMCMESQPGTNEYGPNPFELASGDEISGHLLKDDIV